MVRLDSDSGALDGVDSAWLFGFLAHRAIPGLEHGDARQYRRLISTPRGLVLGTAMLSRGQLRAGIVPVISGLERSWGRRLLDLDRDLRPFQGLAATDRVLANLVRRRPGIRIPQLADPFEAAVRAIVGQLISVAAARSVLARLVTRLGPGSPTGNHPVSNAFPGPEVLAGVPVGQIRACGLTGAKAEAIAGLAIATVQAQLDWTAIAGLPAEEADRALRRWRGIGPWTAGYIRLRAFGDPDVSLATDLGVAHALAALGVSRRRATATLERWRPWRSYAMMHLWASLQGGNP